MLSDLVSDAFGLIAAYPPLPASTFLLGSLLLPLLHALTTNKPISVLTPLSFQCSKTISPHPTVLMSSLLLLTSQFRSRSASNAVETAGSVLDSILFSTAVMERELQNLKEAKSSGPDNIPAKLLKELANELSKPLANIFRSSFELGRLPSEWKTANIFLIDKGGARTSANNYRPVSLTCICRKLMEAIVKKATMKFLEQNHLLSDLQHDFRQNRSSLSSLLFSTEQWTRALDEDGRVDAIYTDKRKVADMGGVPQGSVLGPLLFLVYINDCIDDLGCSAIMFADDVKLWRAIRSDADRWALQDSLNRLNSWSARWLLNFNLKKCVVLRLRTKKTSNEDDSFQYVLGGQPLSNVAEQKDPGVLMTSSLKPSSQCQKSAKSAIRVLFALRRGSVQIDRELFGKICGTFVRSHLEYAVQAWRPWLKKDYQRLERVQAMATKMVKNLHYLPYETRLSELNLFPLNDRQLRGDLIQTYGIVRGRECALDFDEFFELAGTDRLRGHPFKLQRKLAHSDVRRNAFSHRVIGARNGLPDAVVLSETVESFKFNRLLSSSQHGFLPERSCETCHLAFLNLITSLRNEQLSVVVIYSDLNKAFDEVPHRRLLVKLKALGIRQPLLDFIGSYLCNRYQKVMSYDQSDLQRLFERLGPIRQCKLIRDKRLFSHFGRILWVRFLPSDAMKTATSALADLNCNTTEANLFGTRSQISSKGPMTSIIFEERSSCDTAIGRLNGLQLPDCPTPLCLRLIGPVTRETFDMFYLNSRLGSDCSSLAGLQTRQISVAQCHLQEKLGLPGSACSVTNGILKMSHPRSTLEAIEPNENALPSLTSLQPRPIIRNKNLLDGGAVANGISRSIVDRISSPDTQSLFAKQAHQGMDLIAKPDLGSQMSWNSGASLMPLTSVDQFRSTLRAPELAVPKKLSIATPLLLSPQLSAAVSTKGGRASVYLKLENLQPTGSVLFRGMEYACRKFASLGGAQHIVCPSTGNAGVAAAFAAQSLGMACTVVTPEGNESLTRKRLSIEAPSAKLVSFGSTLSEASRRAEQMVNDANEQLQQINGTTDSAVRFLHPYDQTDVWAGYESIIEELPAGQQPDLIVLAVGGGGLLSGLIQGLWNRSWSSTHILAVETEGADCLSRSVAAGHPVVMPKCTSVATSLCAPSLSLRAWSMIQCHPVTAITCSDLEAVQAARRFLDDHGMLVEPACGAALSAVYSGAIAKLQQENVIPRPASVCVILCGGRNTNLQLLTECERKLTTGCGGGTGISNNSKTFGLKQLNGFGGPEVFLADLTEAPMTARSMDENIDQFSDIPTSSSSTSSASDSVVRASSKTHMDTDDQSRE
ncbi:hypothetical protein SprV_0401610800 [Sparganum proliferum]